MIEEASDLGQVIILAIHDHPVRLCRSSVQSLPTHYPALRCRPPAFISSVHHTFAALPVRRTQIFLQDDDNSVLSRCFVAQFLSLPLRCHFSLVLRLAISRLCIGAWDLEVRRDA